MEVTHIETDRYITGNLLYSSKYTNGVYNLSCSLVTVDKDFLQHQCAHLEPILTSEWYKTFEFVQVNSTIVAMLISIHPFSSIHILSRETQVVLRTVEISYLATSLAVLDSGSPSIVVAEPSGKRISKVDLRSYNVSTIVSLPVEPINVAVWQYGDLRYIYFTFAGGLARYAPHSEQEPNNVEYLIPGSTYGYRDGHKSEALLSENPIQLYFLTDRVLLLVDKYATASVTNYETGRCTSANNYRLMYYQCQEARSRGIQSTIRIMDLNSDTIWTAYFDYGCSAGGYRYRHGYRYRIGCQDGFVINGRITSLLYSPSDRRIILTIDHSYERNVTLYIVTETEGKFAVGCMEYDGKYIQRDLIESQIIYPCFFWSWFLLHH